MMVSFFYLTVALILGMMAVPKRLVGIFNLRRLQCNPKSSVKEKARPCPTLSVTARPAGGSLPPRVSSAGMDLFLSTFVGEERCRSCAQSTVSLVSKHVKQSPPNSQSAERTSSLLMAKSFIKRTNSWLQLATEWVPKGDRCFLAFWTSTPNANGLIST